MSYSRQPLVVGDTADFTLYVKKDGAVWDITGASILLYLRNPNGVELDVITVIVSNGPTGKAHVVCTEELLDVSGDWTRKWKVSREGVIVYTRWIPFYVAP